MSVRERLNAFMKLDSAIECKRAQYDKARALPAELCTGRTKEMVEKISAEIERLEAERQAIMHMVDNTPTLTPDELTVLYRHYLEGLTFEAIGKEIHYATTSVFRLCMKATAKVAEQWENT